MRSEKSFEVQVENEIREDVLRNQAQLYSRGRGRKDGSTTIFEVEKGEQEA